MAIILIKNKDYGHFHVQTRPVPPIETQRQLTVIPTVTGLPSDGVTVITLVDTVIRNAKSTQTMSRCLEVPQAVGGEAGIDGRSTDRRPTENPASAKAARSIL